MPGRPMSRIATSGTNVAIAASACEPSAPSRRHSRRLQQRRKRRRGVAIVVDDQDPAVTRLRAGPRRLPRRQSAVRQPARGAALRVNSLPRPVPSLRASTSPPCISTSVLHDRKAEPKPAGQPVDRLRGLARTGRTRAAGAPRRCRRPRRCTSIRARPRPAQAQARSRPGSGVNLAALISRFDTTCASRISSPATTHGRRGTSTRGERVRRSNIGPVSSTALAMTSRRSTRSRRSCDLALRDARDVEQVVDEPRAGDAPGAR